MPSRLIRSKFERPRLSPTHVRRPRLFERLEAGLDARVTLVSAPAGFGKSILAAQWLAQADAPPAAWLCLDPLDRDLGRFLQYLVTALEELGPGGFERTQALLKAPTLPTVEVAADRLAMDLHGMEGVLVLDALDQVGGTAVVEFLGRLVLHGPEGIHLLLLSRVDPPFRLSLWRTRDWLREIRAGDLRFTSDEGRAFLSAAGLDALGDAASSLLLEKVDGWPAGLRLAQLSLRGASDPDHRVRELTGTSRLVSDYLVDEVLGGLSQETRRLLGVACHLERFSAPLCDHLLSSRGGGASCGALFDRLYHENVFLFPSTARDGWYRFHPLFRQFLTDRADELAPDESRETVWSRAVAWFEREDLPREALRLRVAAGDLDGATEMVGGHLHALLDGDRSRTALGEWLALLPAEEVRRRTVLRVAALWAHLAEWNEETILQELDEIQAALRPDGEDARWAARLSADLSTIRAYGAYWAGRFEEALEGGRNALETPRPPCAFRDGVALSYRDAGLAAVSPDEYEAMPSPAGGGESPTEGDGVLFYASRAGVALHRGDLPACAHWVERLCGNGRGESPDPYLTGMGRFFLGLAAYERNELDEAKGHFEAVRVVRRETAHLFAHFALLGLGAVQLARGDQGAALALADQAGEFAREKGNLRCHLDVALLRHRIAASLGHDPGPVPEPSLPDFMRFSPHLPTESWVLARLAGGETDWIPEALARLEDLTPRAERAGMERAAIRLTVARALVLRRADRSDEAVDAIREALARAEPLGLIRSLVDFGPEARELIVETVGSEVEGPFVHAVLVGFGEAASARQDPGSAPEEPRRSGAGSSAPPHGLTRRELSVLELLQHRLTNKEIATRLWITAESVRKYTVTIYRKLGVGSRRQAVAAALARGLLTEDEQQLAD